MVSKKAAGDILQGKCCLLGCFSLSSLLVLYLNGGAGPNRDQREVKQKEGEVQRKVGTDGNLRVGTDLVRIRSAVGGSIRNLLIQKRFRAGEAVHVSVVSGSKETRNDAVEKGIRALD